MLDKRTEKRKIGDIGENVACAFLEKRGFTIIERNYLRKWGEIDIVAREKGGKLHFVEVKTAKTSQNGVTHATPSRRSQKVSGVTIRPEENMHPHKLKRLARTIQTYLMSKRVDEDWQLDLITVKLDMQTHHAQVEIFENIII